jgi:hypothetical protein
MRAAGAGNARGGSGGHARDGGGFARSGGGQAEGGRRARRPSAMGVLGHGRQVVGRRKKVKEKKKKKKGRNILRICFYAVSIAVSSPRDAFSTCISRLQVDPNSVLRFYGCGVC